MAYNANPKYDLIVRVNYDAVFEDAMGVQYGTLGGMKNNVRFEAHMFEGDIEAYTVDEDDIEEVRRKRRKHLQQRDDPYHDEDLDIMRAGNPGPFGNFESEDEGVSGFVNAAAYVGDHGCGATEDGFETETAANFLGPAQGRKRVIFSHQSLERLL